MKTGSIVRAALILDSNKTHDLSPFQAGTTCTGFLFAPMAAFGEIIALFFENKRKKALGCHLLCVYLPYN